MFVELRLTHREVETLVELLESAARQLYSEVWHTDSGDLRRELNGRLRTLDRLAERLRGALAEEAQVPAGVAGP
jgi:hypothetical protein